LITEQFELNLLVSTHIKIRIRTVKGYQISEILAIAAMILLLTHIADGTMERTIKHRFLPVAIDKNPLGISSFGISSIILFFLAIGLAIRNKDTSNVTKTLIIVGGATIGTTVLGVSMMDKSGGWIITFLTVSVIGYIIMGFGILKATLLKGHVSIESHSSKSFIK
jgi:hypothetical protein